MTTDFEGDPPQSMCICLKSIIIENNKIFTEVKIN